MISDNIVPIIMISIIQINVTYARLFEDVHPLHNGRVLQIETFRNLFHFRRKRDLLENLVPSQRDLESQKMPYWSFEVVIMMMRI